MEHLYVWPWALFKLLCYFAYTCCTVYSVHVQCTVYLLIFIINVPPSCFPITWVIFFMWPVINISTCTFIDSCYITCLRDSITRTVAHNYFSLSLWVTCYMKIFGVENLTNLHPVEQYSLNFFSSWYLNLYEIYSKPWKGTYKIF